jgi:hypothetical protein
MALRKRQGTYHADFTINGERYRQSLETHDWREAVQKENDLKARAREGKLAQWVTAEFSRLAFSVAVERYLKERSITAIKATVGQEATHFKTIAAFLGAKRLNQITADDIRQYQARRLAQGRHPNTVNHEVKALLRLLKRCKLASRLRDDVRLLPVRREPRRCSLRLKSSGSLRQRRATPNGTLPTALRFSRRTPPCGPSNSGASSGRILTRSAG